MHEISQTLSLAAMAIGAVLILPSSIDRIGTALWAVKSSIDRIGTALWDVKDELKADRDMRAAQYRESKRP
jgi:hypothetical protein